MVTQLINEKPCSSIDKLIQHDPSEWLKDRPKELIGLLETICKLNIKKETDAFMLSRCIEQLYAARHKRLVLPNAFSHTLLIHFRIVNY